MSLTPLLNASPAIQIHALMALCLIPLTIAIFTVKRGNAAHRIMGWVWVILMGTVALSSFTIHTIKLVGPFSPIHLLSLFTLLSLVRAVRSARRHDRRRHRQHMLGLVWGALVVAGAFTLLPGRLMYAVISGG